MPQTSGTEVAAIGGVLSKKTATASSGQSGLPRSFREEIEQLSEEGLIPLLVIVFAFWLVCAVEWTRKLAGAAPDPRFWTLLSLVITAYGGVQVFRLRPRLRRPSTGKRLILGLTKAIDRICSKNFIACAGLSPDGFKIDYVLVGPSGIFAIQATTRAVFGSGVIDWGVDDKLLIGGRITDSQPLRQAGNSADALGRQLHDSLPLGCRVTGLVVFLGDWKISSEVARADVPVLSLDQLENYLEQRPPELTSADISSICSHLQRFKNS